MTASKQADKQASTQARTDYGTDQIHKHQVVRPELTGRGHAIRMRVKDGTELDRLHMKGLINPFQHSAGQSFSRDLHRARLLGQATVNFTGNGGGGQSITDAQADALGRVSDVLRRLDRVVGVGVRALTVNLCLSRVQLSEHQALRCARQGLDVLLSHYERRHQTVWTVREEDLLA